MGDIREPIPALLVIPAFSGLPQAMALAREKAILDFGPLLRESEVMPFDCTAYYADEMGPDLRLVIWAFERRVPPGELAAIKHRTNAIEAEAAAEGGFPVPRPVNLDPGLLSLDKLALATTKSRSHRLHIGGGIYAESTLRHHGSSYVPWPWTYPSYQRAGVLEFFNRLREDVLKQKG